MTTSRQQAAINLARQIDKLRLWAAGTDPQIAQMINHAIGAELEGQASGYFTKSVSSQAGMQGFGDVQLVPSDPISIVPLDTTVPLVDTSTNLATPSDLSTSGAASTGGIDLSSFDLGSLGNVFSSAGSGASPAFSATTAASNPQSVAGVINSIGATLNSAINAFYGPQVTIAQAQAQLGLIKAQAEAAGLALTSQAYQQTTIAKLIPIAAIGVIGIFALKELGNIGSKRQTTTTSSSRNY